MAFRHIHCSSRFDRSPESLESDLDEWMSESSLITLTEVAQQNRAAKLREKGWGHYNASKSRGADNCAIAWKKADWNCTWQGVRKLHTSQYIAAERGILFPNYVHACAVLLHNGPNKLLVMVAHLPNGVDDMNPGFKTVGQGWESRRKAYQESIDTWSTWTKHLVRQKKPDAVMVIADWNVSLKETWFRHYLKDHWGKGYLHAWKQFPTDGSSLHGGPVAPLGAPGVSGKDRIIDGTLYAGLKVTQHPNLMGTVKSSDHRPYRESFRFKEKAEQDDDTTEGGDTYEGEAWWGFGDYMTDELYDLEVATGDRGGEVL